MWTVLLLWKSIWLYMLVLVVIADCGRYVTTSNRTVSYIHDVTEENHLIFAYKMQSYALNEIHLYNDTMQVGVLNIRPDGGRIMVLTKEGCNETGIYTLSYNNIAKQNEFRWMWISWNETTLEIGLGIVPGLSLLCSGSFFHELKYLGFAKNGVIISKTNWIIGETNELINESKFKNRKGRRMNKTSKGFLIKSPVQCAFLCLRLNGCYGFNLLEEVNGFYKCELIQTDVPNTSCGQHPIVDWDGDIAPAWTHYFL